MLFGEIIRIDRNILKRNKFRKLFDDTYESRSANRTGWTHYGGRKYRPRTWELLQAKKHFSKVSRAPAWFQLIATRDFIARMNYPNQLPAVLVEIVARRFFRRYPKGEIWLVRRDLEILGRSIWGRDFSLARKYDLPETAFEPHASSGLGIIETMLSTGVSLPLVMTFPYILGISADTICGTIILLPRELVGAFDPGQYDASRELQMLTAHVYADYDTPSFGLGIKRPILVKSSVERTAAFSMTDFESYLRWTLRKMNELLSFVETISPDELSFLTALSISRIVNESYLTATSYLPLSRLLLCFGILDKYANLAAKLNGSPLPEPEIWKRYLGKEKFLDEIVPLVEKADGLGPAWADLGRGLYEEITYLPNEEPLRKTVGDVPSDELLRTLRNSTHGYLLDKDRDRKIILSHSGEVSNYIPDIVLVLWNAFLANPKDFLKIN